MLKQKLSLILVLAMVATMLISVGTVSAAGGIIVESGLETADDSKALIGNGNYVMVGKGVNGTNAVTNYLKKTFYPKAPLLPTFEKGKTYHVSILAKGTEADIAKMVFKAYYNGGSGVTDAKVAVVGDSASKAFTTGHVEGEFAQKSLTTETWSRLGFRLTVGTNGTSPELLAFLLDSASMEVAAGQVLFDNMTIVEESAEASAEYTKPFIYDSKVSTNGGTKIKEGDVLTFSAYTYDANQNVVPSVSYKITKSADGITWTDVTTVSAEMGSLNSYGTYTATANYTATAAEEGCIIKAVATASSTGTEGGLKTDSCDSGAIGKISTRGIIVESALETAEDSVAINGGNYTNYVAVGQGVNGSNAITHYAKTNGQFFPSAHLRPVFENGKTYHISILAKGAEAAVDSLTFRAYYGETSTATDAKIKLVGASASQSYTGGWSAGEYDSKSLNTSDWTRLGFRLTVGTNGNTSETFLFQLLSEALKTTSQVLFDNMTIVEEYGENAVDYTRPFVFDSKVSSSGDEKLATGDVLSFTAHTYDANQNVVPSVSYKIVKSDDGITWTDVTTVDAEISSLNSFGTYTATASYTVTADEAGSFIKAVATASSSGVEGGAKTDSCETGVVGQLPEITVSYDSTNGSVEADGEVIATEYTVNAKSITLDIKPNAGFAASAEVNGQAYEISNNQLILSNLSADTAIEIKFTATSVKPSVSFKQAEVVPTTHNGSPAWMVYVLPSVGSGYTVSEYGTIISDGTNSLKLKALEADEVTPSTGGAAFGIKVFGDVFNTPGTYSFRPFITFINGEASEDAVTENTAEFTVSE